jgi:hypothetical protein
MSVNTTKGNAGQSSGSTPKKQALSVAEVQALEQEKGEARFRSAQIAGEVRALESALETARRDKLGFLPGAGDRVADLERQINGLTADAARLDARELEIIGEIAATVGPVAWREDAAREFGLSAEIAVQLEGDTPAKIHAHAQKIAQSIAGAAATATGAQPGDTRYPFQSGREVAW